MKITEFVLKKPITTFLVILSIIFFGVISLIQFKYELLPDITMPMYAVVTVYPGASPEDVDDNVVSKLEEELYGLSGVKDVTCVASSNYGLVLLQYNYGQNMDKAYNDLKKKLDTVSNDFNEGIQDPYIMEMDVNSIPVCRLAVRNSAKEDIYNYVQNTFMTELEKIADVSSCESVGGREGYIKISLRPEQMARYNLSMSSIQAIVKNADFSYPAGTVKSGSRDLSFSSKVKYDTIESLKNIPIITGNNRTLYLSDIADVYVNYKDETSVGRYNAQDCMIVSVQKVQSASSVSVSRDIDDVVAKLKAADPNLEVTKVTDQAENILASIKNVFQTMIMAIILSMIVLFLFLGDLKGSIIIGTSIPFSILVALVCIRAAGYTLNLITLSALVLGVGMMVDNSICVLEQCFRSKEKFEGNDLKSFVQTALDATNIIGFSIFGSTMTTVVVFLPLGLLEGMSGQFFKPLGFTIVFCMLASFVSAIVIVPLAYVLLKPIEKKSSPIGPLIRRMQHDYRNIIPMFLRHKYFITFISLVILVIGFALVPTFKTELVADADEHMVKISITTKPGLNLEKRNEIYKYFEDYVQNQPEVEDYLLSNSASSMYSTDSSGGQALIAYLKDNKTVDTKHIINKWTRQLEKVPDCVIDVSNYSTSFTSSFVMNTENKLDVYVESSDYDALKRANDKIAKELEERDDITDIVTMLDNGTPVIDAVIDPILAASEGFTPAQVGGLLYNMVSGVELYDMKIDGDNYTVRLEFPDGEYDTIDKVSGIVLTSANGTQTTLSDIANISMVDSPTSIQKLNKKYRTRFTGKFNENATKDSTADIIDNVIKPNMTSEVSIAQSSVDKMLNEEFFALYLAVATAIFLVFVVMASQFESIRFSLMVMGTVLYSFSGAFYALWLGGLKLSMTALLGFLMLVGTAVNNGILFVDTANQNVEAGMPVEKALTEAGAIRLRPILMTTLTTLVSMIPMSIAYGKNGEILQPLGVSNMGGLIISTFMAFFILPVLYYIFTKNRVTKLEELAHTSKKVVESI